MPDIHAIHTRSARTYIAYSQLPSGNLHDAFLPAFLCGVNPMESYKIYGHKGGKDRYLYDNSDIGRIAATILFLLSFLTNIVK